MDSMKKIGIVVCNYNKEDYIVNCVDSILKSDFQDFDVYVVDNASTDRSVELLKERFGEKIHLIVNTENLGGSGGFNTGLREVLKYDYPYVMCVDNDVIMEKQAIRELYEFLEQNPTVGMVGSKICIMDVPDRIQTYGAMIDFNCYLAEDLYRNYLDDEQIPEVVYCDYVPACSLMARTDAVRKVGIMPEENFIYWDDMEWGYRFNQEGYQVAAISASRIWHKRGGAVAKNTFTKYYFFRNRIRFFLKYLAEDKKEAFARFILDELYRSVCSCNLKGEYNMMKTFMYAYDDAIHDISGKAQEHKILPRLSSNRLADLIKDAEKIQIVFNGDYECLGNVIQKLQDMSPELQCTICVRDCMEEAEKVVRQYPEMAVVKEHVADVYDLTLKLCSHIFEVQDRVKEGVYIDRWLNLLITEEEFELGRNFKNSNYVYIQMHLPLVMQK